MDGFNELLRPQWGSEKWILEGWEIISEEEKKLIKKRMDELFKDGLPFEIKHDKLLYVNAFSLLAQLEVLAIQVPLKFKDKMVSQENKDRMHNQLLDEIFHGLIFTKIIYMLSAPYAIPPEYNDNVEKLCNFIRNEECPKVAVMLLNLIAEGWIEEAFKCYAEQGIAPKVFNTILTDEHRHVDEAELYRDIGLPDRDVIKSKIEFLEEQLLVNFFLQHKYMLAAPALLGFDGATGFIQALDAKHRKQLKKIDMAPSKRWDTLMLLVQNIAPKILQYAEKQYEVPMSAMRQTLMTQWKSPNDATMVSQFCIDVTPVDFFNKKYPPETLTTLTMQTISLCLKETESFRSYLHYRKLYRSKEAYVGVIVQLPGCGDQIGTIVFENCHTMSLVELSQRIRSILAMMVYCYKKREELEKKHPHLELYDLDTLLDFAHDIYGYSMPGSPIVTVSNIGSCGYTEATTPLLKNESIKFVMLEVDRKQVWNRETNAFEIQDQLPISISADHRVFDGNVPVPKIIKNGFERMFEKMHADLKKPVTSRKPFNNEHFIESIETLIHINVELGYKFVCALPIFWPDFFELEDLMSPMQSAKIAASLV